MKHTRFVRVNFTFFVMLLSACDSNPMIIMKMNLEEGVLTSRDSKCSLRLRAKRPYKILEAHRLGGSSSRTSSIIAHCHNGEFEVAIKVSPSPFSTSQMVVAFAGKMLDSETVEIQNARYFYNEESAQALEFSRGGWYRSEFIDNTFKSFGLTLPHELQAHPIREHGDGILNPREFEEQLESERYRFLIGLVVNDEPYTLDMRFRFRLGKGMRFGVPAMP